MSKAEILNPPCYHTLVARNGEQEYCLTGIGPLSPFADVLSAEIDPNTTLRTAGGVAMIATTAPKDWTFEPKQQCFLNRAKRIVGKEGIVLIMGYCPICGDYCLARTIKSK